MKKNLIELLENKTRLPFNLQLFADNGEGEGNQDDSQDDDSQDDSDDDSQDDDSELKQFTQTDLNNIATKEKKQGRKSALKELGFNSEKEAKAEIEEFRKWKQSQLTPEQKKQKEIDDSNVAKNEAEQRAKAAEEKLAVVIAGVRKDSIDDVLAIARVKVTDEKSLDDVLDEMKKEDRYKSFFDSSNDSNNGTGGNLNHKKGSNKDENIGERLAKKQANQTKSHYFN